MIIGLSGGGARSFAHVGIMKAVYEKGIEPAGFCGTSGGSIIATLLANGWTLGEIQKWSCDTQFDKLIRLSKFSLLTHLGRPEGLMNNKRLGEVFDKFQSQGLLKPVDNLWINATNTNSFEERVFTKQDYEDIGYGDIIRASTAIPGIISPIQIQEQEYSDGGVSANPCLPPFPTQRNILIFHLGYPGKDGDPHSWFSNITTAIEAIQWHRDRYIWQLYANVRVIKLSVKHVKSTDFGLSRSEKERLFKYGYEKATEALKRL